MGRWRAVVLTIWLAFGLGLLVGVMASVLAGRWLSRRPIRDASLFTPEAEGLDRQLSDYVGDVDSFTFFQALMQVYIYDALVRLAPPHRRRPPPRRR